MRPRVVPRKSVQAGRCTANLPSEPGFVELGEKGKPTWTSCPVITRNG